MCSPISFVLWKLGVKMLRYGSEFDSGLSELVVSTTMDALLDALKDRKSAKARKLYRELSRVARAYGDRCVSDSEVDKRVRELAYLESRVHSIISEVIGFEDLDEPTRSGAL